MSLSPPLPPALLLMGPTASGKTAVALELAAALPVDLISVDSALVFRDMDIGTAKPDRATLARFPHRLVDILSPEEAYSAARFREDALAAMGESAARGRIPLLVGGTMLYFKALRQGLSDLPQADPALRAALEADGRERGWPTLHAELARLDPATAARLHPTDPQRIQRALEIIRLTGRPMSALLAEQRPAPLPYRLLPLALAPTDRSALHQRIADRFRAMLEAGFMEEMAMLRAKYQLHGDLPSMRCVGYRQAWEVLEGQAPAVELADRGIFATRQLAKRQITWLRADPTAEVFDCLAPDLSAQVATRVRAFLQA
ncbi:tRNA (adenosine(37)-N6)-dimethylallyltransferase MiaA [Azospira inquinata]|uniref:tRNA dimethylallyltransferase n=1 Tax=Azospira inquinata TaxID=2785627 RepID=A0A975XU01_9RHOO|nr:tRNA (adenosine(37)-N6)-dimethylallyltransferase MiaA [Azospira inquinata]QWT46403.1 tRNA (adenosine(37)-N6)-dimethylallyltransferase MiaA [Azospira inquinata]QWT48274.1 tRNA (adenosine(37)-N6)-dimethylallyltransferase MiaA [Azospira inquinata]